MIRNSLLLVAAWAVFASAGHSQTADAKKSVGGEVELTFANGSVVRMSLLPDEIEIETKELREKVHDELEREGGSLLRTIAMSTAIVAAFAAVAALRAGSTVNEALVLKTEATRAQVEELLGIKPMV